MPNGENLTQAFMEAYRFLYLHGIEVKFELDYNANRISVSNYIEAQHIIPDDIADLDASRTELYGPNWVRAELIFIFNFTEGTQLGQILCRRYEGCSATLGIQYATGDGPAFAWFDLAKLPQIEDAIQKMQFFSFGRVHEA